MARATLKDVAQEAGVSSATVSYILNGKRSILKKQKPVSWRQSKNWIMYLI